MGPKARSDKGEPVEQRSPIIEVKTGGIYTVETEKVYVNLEDTTAVIKCPTCGTAKTRYVGKFRGSRRSVKVRCQCQSIFRVSFEFRRTFRKGTNLPGFYTQLPEADEWSKMLVTDISITGIGFSSFSAPNLTEGDELKVRFTLDDGRRSQIEKKAVVRWVNDTNVGCQFMRSVGYDERYDTALNFYLMP